MIRNRHVARKISVASALVVVLACGAWWSVSARAADEKHGARKNHHVTHLRHVKTRAEVEVLKPGDMVAMVCSMCMYVELHHVTPAKSHVKLMTAGEKHTCAVCRGDVKVVGTGKGTGNKEEVKHVCSKCGDEAMFVCATATGGGAHEHDSEGR